MSPYACMCVVYESVITLTRLFRPGILPKDNTTHDNQRTENSERGFFRTEIILSTQKTV